MLRTPPFLKAPLLLFRHRVVLAAVFGAAVILGLVVALTPQFLSSATSAALEHELDARCDSSYHGSMEPGLGSTGRVIVPGVNMENRERLVEAVGGQSNIGEPRGTIMGQTVLLVPNGDPARGFQAEFLHRSGYEDQIEVLRGGGTSGVWIDEYVAERYGVDLGDVLTYRIDVGTEMVRREIEVTAITEDQADLVSRDFWCGVRNVIGLTPTGDRRTPIGLVGFDVFDEELSSASHFLRLTEYWELTVEVDGLTPTIADEIVATFSNVGQKLYSDPELVQSDLGHVRERVAAMGVALSTSVRPLAIVVTVVAFGLMAAAGSYWVDRRHAELRMLSAVGLGPMAMGLKAALEMVLPVSVGVVAGAVLSMPVAGLVGPGGAIEDHARWEGINLAPPTILACVLVVAAIAAVRSRGLLLESVRRNRIRRWTFSIALVAALVAYLVRRGIGEEAVVFRGDELVGSVDPRVMLFPSLVFLAVALIAGKMLLWIVSRARVSPRQHSSYIASRRLASHPGPAIVLLAGALVPIATLVYSAALTRSAEASVEAKGKVFVGSDVRAPVFGFDELPPALAERSTYVRRAERVDIAETQVDFQVVDPATFGSGAFWHQAFSDRSLEELLDVIDDSTTPLPAIVANADLGVNSGQVELSRVDVPIQVRETTLSFPGARGSRPLIVVGKEAFDDFVTAQDLPTTQDGTLSYLWVSGLSGEMVQQALGDADIGYAFTTTSEEVLDLIKFQVIIWTFDFLELYAAVAGLIVIGAILLYADTRQRARNLSYALAMRMGLTRSEHIRAGLIEFGGLVVVGAIIGSVVAHLTARAIYRSLDALPSTPPSPLWIGTIDLILILLVVSVGVGWLAAIAAQRTADNADVAELLRHGD